mmetsp:Transcript_37745/g.121081  ORF Transcript_37745/g.121081 Transcript_37745/m.121081 type:complete len:228 (-) Transcript_37745:5-688(-)
MEMRAKARAFWGMRVLRDRGAGHKRFRVGGRLLGGLSTACRLRANGEADHDRGENEEARRRHACEAAGARGGLCLLGQSEGADRGQVHLDARRRDAGELWARPPAEALVLLAALAAAVCFFELDADAVDALRAAALALNPVVVVEERHVSEFDAVHIHALPARVRLFKAAAAAATAAVVPLPLFSWSNVAIRRPLARRLVLRCKRAACGLLVGDSQERQAEPHDLVT